MSSNRISRELVKLTEDFFNPFKDGRKSDWTSAKEYYAGEVFVVTVFLWDREKIYNIGVAARQREVVITKPFRYGEHRMIEYVFDDGHTQWANTQHCQYVTDFLSLCEPATDEVGLSAAIRALPDSTCSTTYHDMTEILHRLIVSGKITEGDVVEAMTWKGEEIDRTEWKTLHAIRTAPLEEVPTLMGKGFDDAVAERLGKE